MDDLIKAIEIFTKYSGETVPVYVRDGTLIVRVDACYVSKDDRRELVKLAFGPTDFGREFAYNPEFRIEDPTGLWL